MTKYYFCCLLSFFIHIVSQAQVNDADIKRQLNEYYLSGCFQEGLVTCNNLLADSAQLSEDILIFTKIKKGLFHKDADQFRSSLSIFKELEIKLRGKGDSLSETYLELIQHYSFVLASDTQWDLAEKFAEKAYNNCKKQLGEKHPLFALAIFHRGYVYNHRRQYAKAEQLLQEAAVLQKNILGEKHRDYAQTVHFLGGLNLNKAEFDLARYYYSEALAIRRQVFKCVHPRIAALIMNLGLTEVGQGRLEEAEKWFRSASRELGLLGNFSSGTASTNNYNLANVLISLGRYAEARSILTKNINLIIDIKGKDHPDNAMNTQSIGLTYQREGKLQEAKQNFEESLRQRERILGKKHPHYAESLVALATIEIEYQNWQKAIERLEAAKLLTQEIQGEKHPDYAQSVLNLGYAQFKAGHQVIGIENINQALSILKSGQGVEHINYIQGQYKWAEILKASGRFEETIEQIESASTQQQKLLIRASSYLPENDLETYTYEFSQGLTRQFALLQPNAGVTVWEDQGGLYYNALLFYKGFVAQQMYQFRALMRNQADTSLQLKFNQWQQLQRQIAQEYAKSITSRSNNLAQLETQAKDLEASLVQRTSTFASLRQEVQWTDVQRNLKPHEAAIEFFEYQPAGTEQRTYAAVILHPGWPNPRVVQLGPITELHQAYDQTLYTWLKGQRGIEPVKVDFSSRIYSLIWQPLEQLLQGVKTIYYAPIGGLNTLPLHALPTEKPKELLGERYDLVLMSSTRTILDQQANRVLPVQSALLVGGVNYNQSSRSLDHTSGGNHVAKMRSQMALRSVPNWDEVSWQPLPGSAIEVKTIHNLLQKKGSANVLLSDTAATEARVKSLLSSGLQTPDLVHLATHGFAFQDTLQRTGLHYSILHNPLLRTGLVLAGANQHRQSSTEGGEDGILTAFEIKGFSLQGAQLVVLSACDSGLGEVRREEGVFGLPRAFKMAGARHLLVSLWAARDEETAQFMGYFYRNWMKGQSIRDAFWKARATMQKKYSDPRIWAGFVLWE